MNHTAIGCDANFEVVVKDPTEQVAFNDTGVLGAGSDVKFRLTSQAHCHTAVFWKDVEGQVFNLISIASNNLPSIEMAVGEVQLIPDSWLTLDQNSGLETIYLISSETPLTDLSQIGLLLANDGPLEIKARLTTKDLTVRWKTIEHTVDARTEKLLLPPRSQQLALTQLPDEIDQIPSKAEIPPTHHATVLKQLPIGSQASVRGIASHAIARSEKAVVYIYTSGGFGSGVVVDKQNGLIVTNQHVVEGFDEVGVIFQVIDDNSLRDQRVYMGDVETTVTEHDLALIRLRNIPESLSAFPLGDPGALEKGMTVHAIGHPEGLLWTYTKGYVSHIRPRYVWEEGRVADVIQSQTPISSGSSGGPLFDDRGQLMGINTYGMSHSGHNLSISVNHVKELIGTRKQGSPKDAFLSLSNPGLSDESYDRDQNGVADLFCFDTDKNGRPDICIVDKNEDGKIDHWALDLNENRVWDGYVFQTSTGLHWLYDIDEDGKMDLEAYDLDSNGTKDYYGPFSG